MNMYKLVTICLLLSSTACSFSVYENEELDTPEEQSAEQSSMRRGHDHSLRDVPPLQDGKLYAFGALHAFSTFALYNNNEHFRQYCDAQSAAGKHYMLKSVLLPSLMKVEKIKDEGLTSADLLKLGSVVGACYGIKKAGEHLNLWDSIKTGDFTKTRTALSGCAQVLGEHKFKIAAGGLLIAGALFCWKLSQAADTCTKMSHIDRFFLSLTNEQRAEIMESPELKELVAQGTANPVSLKEHEGFNALLTDEQKSLLTTAADDFIKTSDPIALLEGLDI